MALQHSPESGMGVSEKQGCLVRLLQNYSETKEISGFENMSPRRCLGNQKE